MVKEGQFAIEPLVKAGFKYTGEWNIPFKFGFSKRGQYNINLHVFEENHPEIALNLLFRDYLIANPSSLREYAKIKQDLMLDESSYHKQEGQMFANYSLGKADFITNTLIAAGYKGRRFLKVAHKAEWDAYQRIKKQQVFDSSAAQTIAADQHHHFILSVGMQIVAISHIELLGKTEAKIKALATAVSYTHLTLPTKA